MKRESLLRHLRARKPFDPIPAPVAARIVDEAYAVQEASPALMAATHGPVAGYKIALTTPDTQGSQRPQQIVVK